ncbi:putative non-ribosomal peptide synthetase [Gordonia effusa NBRC 100432]|uniref:Putative non-ribosomal peptide synthetase n=1 Tax=Gordonia effusa NBRC 100432 TaxID=1077974 RepID=H0R694_9ACTN|nr:non-ribosomal peptide synthetase [Gordonia effusa]GAB20595.1 putative non-ribosomal peptide synthetase [Gordonia effusa NBRC 100432]
MSRASAAERGLWFAQSVTASSTPFTVAQLIELHGNVDHKRLFAAVRGAVTEADGLGRIFHQDSDGDVYVADNRPIEVTRKHLGVEPTLITAHVEGRLHIGIDPGVGPCASIEILTAGERTAILVVAHHIVIDAYGLGLLVRRAGQLYADLADDRVFTSITTLANDFDAPTPDAADFWARTLAELTGPLTLADAPRPHRIATTTHTARTVVSGAGGLTRSPARLAAAIAAFCSRQAQTDDVVLGFPMMNRFGSPAANIPCSTVNVVPLRVEVGLGDALDVVLERVAGAMRALRPHSHYRGEDIVRDLRRVGVDGAVGPTINIKPFSSTVEFDDLRAEITSLARGPVVDLSIYALDLAHNGTDGDLELLIDADADLYSLDELVRLTDTLGEFVSLCIADASRPIGSLPVGVIDTARRVQAIRDADRSTDIRPETVPILDAIDSHPDDAIAVIADGETLTYGQLRIRSAAIAVAADFAGPEDIVAVKLPRGTELVAALVGVMRTGAAFLPLDPGFPADRIAATLIDADPIAIIEPGADGQAVVTRQNQRTNHNAPRVRPAHNHSPVYVIYTSGSTGAPKGVVVGTRALRNFTTAMIHQIGYRPGQSVLAVTTISFDISLLETVVPLAAGSTVILAATEDVHSPERLARLIADHEVTYMQATPSLWSAILDSGHAPALAGLTVLVGGEQLPADIASALTESASSVTNMYGPTETTIWSTSAPVVAEEAPSIGLPIDNTGIRILDAALMPVQPGRAGELYLSGAGLARGYHGRGELTATRFVADPFSTVGARMYRTGDLARALPDGRLICLGRTDHQVKVRGFRIELGDIESALSQQDSVDRAVVVADDGRLVGYLTPSNGLDHAKADLDLDALRTALASRLPDYMVPSTLIALDSIPLTPNGKVDRRALPKPDFAALAGHTRSPRTDAEKALAMAFADVLGVPRVGADDSFFLLGGDSIGAVRLVAAAARGGWTVTPLDVFDHPTVAGLALVAAAAAPTGESAWHVNTQSTTTAEIGIDELDDLMEDNLL